MKYILTLLLMVLSVAAHADNLPQECNLLSEHKPADDVAYKAGVDVHGKPVVSADLNAAPTIAPKTIVIPLSIDMADRLQNNNMQGLKLEAPLGMLEIHDNGRVVYNGQDWTPQVYALCGKENLLPPLPETTPAAGTADVKPADTGNGQPKTDAIKSDAVEIAPLNAVPPDSVVIEGGESREEGLSK
jgi:hypothetical protein